MATTCRSKSLISRNRRGDRGKKTYITWRALGYGYRGPKTGRHVIRFAPASVREKEQTKAHEERSAGKLNLRQNL